MEIYNLKGQVIGRVENNTHFTARDPQKHYMRIYKGYGISDTVLNELSHLSVEWIHIITPDKVFKFKLSEYIQSTIIWSENGDSQKFVRIPEVIMTKGIKTLGDYK